MTMSEKIQLIHPAGKKAISMDQEKYDLLKKYILRRLASGIASTQSEILNFIKQELVIEKLKFQGSLEWHLEWVKLDLEARKEIRRIGDKSPQKYSI